MRSVTNKFKQLMNQNIRQYDARIVVTLVNGTQLTLDNEDIWSDSIEIDSAISNSNSFDIGSAIISKCTVVLNNIDERFSEYDFFNANAVVYIALHGDTEYHRIGIYTIDEPTYNGSLITLECLDYLWKLDTPFNPATLTSTATAQAIVVKLCQQGGVTLATQQFPNYNLSLSVPKDQEMNCREVLQYVAQACGCFCVMNNLGQLVIKWYNKSAKPTVNDLDGGSFSTKTKPYSDGDSADGGNFTNYSSGDSVDGGTFTDYPNIVYFTHNTSITVGTDEITVTGIKIVIDEVEHLFGTARYVLTIEGNPFITESNVNAVGNVIYSQVCGMTFRTFSATTMSDLSAEVGDVCMVMDGKGERYYSYITRTSFGISATQQVWCDAETPSRTLTKRYSKTVQTKAEILKKVDEQISDFDLAVQLMNEVAVNASGGYSDYEDLPTGGRVWYLSNKPITKTDGKCSFTANSTVFKRTGDGLFVSTNGGTSFVNGYDAQSGSLVVNMLSTIGLSADWIKTGSIETSLITGSVVNAINNSTEKTSAGTALQINANKIDIKGKVTFESFDEDLAKSYTINNDIQEWKTGTTYYKNTIVHYTASSGATAYLRCIASHVAGSTPSTSTWEQYSTLEQAISSLTNTTTKWTNTLSNKYKVGDYVVYGFEYYQCIKDYPATYTSIITLDNTEYWTKSNLFGIINQSLASGRTVIDGDCIKTGTVIASVLQGSVVNAINSSTATDPENPKTKILIKADMLDIQGAVTFRDLDSSTQTTITNASTNASSALTTANSASSTASTTSSSLNTLVNGLNSGTTTINGGCIQTNTLSANTLNGGTINGIDIKGCTITSKSNDLLSDYVPFVSISNGSVDLGAYSNRYQSEYLGGALKFYPDGGSDGSGSISLKTEKSQYLKIGAKQGTVVLGSYQPMRIRQPNTSRYFEAQTQLLKVKLEDDSIANLYFKNGILCSSTSYGNIGFDE